MLRWVLEFAAVAVIAAGLSWVLRTYAVQPFVIPSTSMQNTLLVGDRVLVSRFAYRSAGPLYRDIVVFTSPEDGRTDLIKRVIAVEGQTVEMRGGRVLVDGSPLAEPYVNPDFPDRSDMSAPVTVPAGTVWVMGDNRTNSRDSRFIGPVPTRTILGRAFAIYWPFSRAGEL